MTVNGPAFKARGILLGELRIKAASPTEFTPEEMQAAAEVLKATLVSQRMRNEIDHTIFRSYLDEVDKLMARIAVEKSL